MSEPHAASGTPQEEEPQTPMWLPAVGAALFVGVALWWAVTPPVAPSTPAEAPAAESAAAAAAAPNPQAQAPAVPPAQPRFPPQPAAPSGQGARVPVPSALPAELQKRLNDLRGKPHP
ncbi:MAG TPA: hypothetical protein VF765_12670 [Polyangiaceae bacterium]